MKSWVDITIRGANGVRHRILESGSTVGSGSSADITVRGASGLLPIHCSLRPQSEGCWVELIESAPEPFTYEGKPSRGCLVPWGADLFLDSVRLTLASDGMGKSKGPSPVVWLAALAIPLVGASVLLKQPASGASAGRARDVEPPAMFGELPACSEAQAGALGRAGVAEQIARAKHERGVFELTDLVAGVQLMREAAVCYALGGNQGSSDRTLDEAERWIGDLQFTYKRALLDLELGQRQASLERTLDAIGRLSVLLRHASPEAASFKERLAQLRRNQLARLAESRGK